MLHVKFAGIGAYIPEQIVTSAELEATYGLEAGWIARTTGIHERRRATHETQVEMAARAAQRALAAADMDVAALDLIISASSSRQQTIPCTAAFVQRALGAPEGRSACVDMDATCLSFLFAVQSAAHLVAAGTYRTALIVSSEVGGRSLNPAQPESAVLFGDAAVATILVRTPPNEASGLVWEQFATYSSGADLTAILGGGTLHHPNDPATRPVMNTFTMNGPGIYKKAARIVGPFLDQFFTQAQWQREAVDLVVPHQTSSHGLDLLCRRYGFREDQIMRNIERRGNCVGASIPLALSEALDAGRVTRGQRIVLVGTGAGLTVGAIGLIW